jgi:hypothetical protein
VGLRRWRAALCAVMVSVILTTAGCSGEELFRQPLSGYVTLDGLPLAKGVIVFYPVKNNDLDILVNGGAMVKDGYFSISRRAGLVPGQYHVVIRAAEVRHRRHEGRKNSEDDDAVAKEVVPARYNSETSLIIEINDTAIKELTFHLDS